MHFPTLPNGYRFSVDDGEIFYKALSDYVECFRDVIEFLLLTVILHRLAGRRVA